MGCSLLGCLLLVDDSASILGFGVCVLAVACVDALLLGCWWFSLWFVGCLLVAVWVVCLLVCAACGVLLIVLFIVISFCLWLVA